MDALSILLVDDNPADRLLAEEALRAAGSMGAIEQTNTLSAALVLLDARGSRPWPRMLIVDGHLPDGTGTDLIARLRQRPAAADTIMIMLSGDSRSPPGLEGIDWYEKPSSWKGWQSWAAEMVMRGGTASDA
jgi:CheY-like chemotaxis protein